jgi:hypothetical protein
MKLYEFIANLRLSDEIYDTYYQLIVANSVEEAINRYNEISDGQEIVEGSITCEEILEIDGHKIIVEG